MNSMEIVSVLYHFDPWRKNLRKGRKQHSAKGLRRASRSAREHGPGQQRIRPPGRGDLVEEIAQEGVRLKPDLFRERRRIQITGEEYPELVGDLEA